MTNYLGIFVLTAAIFSVTLCSHDEEIKKYRMENSLKDDEIKVGFSLPEYEKIYANLLPSVPSPDPMFVALVGGSLKIKINGDEAISQIRTELLKLQNKSQVLTVTLKKAKYVVNPLKENVFIAFEVTGDSLDKLELMQKSLSRHTSVTTSLDKVKVPLIEVAVDPMLDPESLRALIDKTNQIIETLDDEDRTFVIEWDVQ
jgi:hypothetical protein